jgi:hypothetical protein
MSPKTVRPIALLSLAAAALIGTCAIAVAAPPAVTATALAQPAGQNSTLIPTNFNAAAAPGAAGNLIYDGQFASWVQAALVTNQMGNQVSMVGDATFAFQQCFGGGFLDDLNTQFGATVNWVGGAASSFNEPSYGQNPGLPVAPAGKGINASLTNVPPADYWTTELYPLLNANSDNPTSINTANANDPYGTVLNGAGPNPENGQLYYPPGKGVINLTTAGANRYAILWAGLTNNLRYFTDVTNMYNKLVALGYNVSVLFGDGASSIQGAGTNDLPNGWGAQAATSNNLQNAIANVGTKIAADYAANKTNDQFFFYATDHGGNTAVVGPGAGGGLIPGAGGPPGTTSPIQISQGDSVAMGLDPQATPTLTINYTMTSPGSAEVLVNGNDIGNIYSGSSSATLAIPDSDLQPGNDSVQFDTLSGPSFQVTGETFFSGAFDTLVPVPEPATLAVVAISGITLLARRRRA